jgi:hypothetical protein
LLAIGVWLSAASAAGAATVTVGSPLTGDFSAPTSNLACLDTDCTIANTSLAESGARATSPQSGTVVQWRIIAHDAGDFALRVLRPAGAGQYTGVGTSPQTISEVGAHTFAANLPIQAGDLIGLDIPEGSDIAKADVAGSAVGIWGPPLADNSTDAPVFPFSDIEVAFNADVQYPDATTPAAPKKKCKKKRKHKRSAESATKKKCKKKKRR